MGFQEREVFAKFIFSVAFLTHPIFVSMDAVFHVEMWDKDTVTADDFIGGASFTLRDISTRHVPPKDSIPPLRLTLLDKKGSGDRY